MSVVSFSRLVTFLSLSLCLFFPFFSCSSLDLVSFILYYHLLFLIANVLYYIRILPLKLQYNVFFTLVVSSRLLTLHSPR